MSIVERKDREKATPLNIMLAGIELNERLVAAGLWHKRFVDMTSASELEAYTFFIFALDDARKVALKLEAGRAP